MIHIKQKPKLRILLGVLAFSVCLFVMPGIFQTIPSASAAIYPFYYVDTPSFSSVTNTEKGVRLTWEPIEDADQYRIFIKNGNSWKRLGDTDGTVFYHTDAVSGETYTYTIRCISEDGSYFTSSYLPAGKTITYLSMPVISRLTNTENGVDITWDAVPGAEKYRVFTKNGTSWKKLGDTDTPSFLHESAVSGTAYTYTVRCISADGKSYTSAYQSAGKTVTYVKAPTMTAFEDEPFGVRLSWDACDGADLYRVYIRVNDAWKTIAETADTSYLHPADNDTEYTYTLRCFNSAGKAVSWFCEEGWTYTHSFSGTLEAPVIAGFRNTENGVRLLWKQVSGAEKYRVLLKNGDTWRALGDTDDNEFYHTDAVPGETYTYTVCCIDADATHYTGVFDSIGKTNRFIKPAVVRSVEITSAGPMISWDDCGADRYRVIAFIGSNWTILGDTTKTAYLHLNGTEGVAYGYQVYCIKENGAPLHAVSFPDMTYVYERNADNPVYQSNELQADICEILGIADDGTASPNAPLTRSTAAEILVNLLRYKSRTNITVSDAPGDNALLTAAYYGYFTPDSKYRVLPDRLLEASEYERILAEVERYARLRGKHILAFGDSIMVGKGNNGGGIVRMLAEKYGMTFKSYALNGASFGTNNTRKHISDEILTAYEAGAQADLILINGGTNDMGLVSNGSGTDFFDSRRPERSTLASGMKLCFEYLNRYWSGVPVIYIRAHNMDICSDTLERQMGEYAVRTAAEYGAAVADIYSETTLNTKSSTQTARYTYDPTSGEGDGIHPNALGYSFFYLPLISEKTEELLT